MAVLNLITIFHAADFSAPYSADLCKKLSGDALEAALCIHYQSRKIKNLVLQTFDEFNLAEQFRQIIAVVMNPLSPTLRFPSLPPIATFSRANTCPENKHIDWATWFSDREPTPLTPDEEKWPEIDQGPFPPKPFVPTTPFDTNYAEWSIQMEALLDEQDLWDVVNGTETMPNFGPHSKVVKVFICKQQLVRAKILLYLSNSQIPHAHVKDMDSKSIFY
ncbi:hypothetical protein AZE42_11325 [Rhizopogon vesiculosus]|uniref:DUF4219 domain-containing protein n=1 Tax=Rhizopogon vesiculosus TaxID=180088 RepID=A0A1J8QMF0_9AGAM|nr:hypothetical protein AZE42_11325 [Rhizopogon vesiculosus]